MEEHQIGWIAAIIIGGIAGWLAEQFMKSVGLGDEHRARHHRSRGCQLAVGLPRHHVRRLDRLFDCRLHRSLHSNRDRPRVQRRIAANMNLHRWRASGCWKVPASSVEASQRKSPVRAGQ